MNMQAMLKQAQALQKDMLKAITQFQKRTLLRDGNYLWREIKEVVFLERQCLRLF